MADAGNALLLRQGYTLAWSGWDPDAPRTAGGLAMQVAGGFGRRAAIVRTIRDELVSGTRGPRRRGLPPDATRRPRLDTVGRRGSPSRRNEADAPSEIPAGGWAYVDARSIRLLPDGTPARARHASTTSGIRPTNPKVLGIGLRRDARLRVVPAPRAGDAGSAEPAGRGIERALAVGISQSGRYLRDHIAQGFNQDEASRKVFDGVLAHISGVGRVFLNAEFGQPGRTNTQHEDHSDPGERVPVLERAR